MKRFSIVLLIVLVVCAIAGFGVARAANLDSKAEVAKDSTYSGLFMRSAESIVIDGTVDGDVIVAGSDVTINGTVNGSVYAAGDTVRITGPVKGNIHAAASEVIYSGRTEGTLFLAGMKVATEASARANNAFMAGSTVAVAGEYAGSLYAAGSQVEVSAKIRQNASLAGGQIKITDKAQIDGNMKYASDQEATVANDRAVAGSISRVSTPQPSAADRFMARLAETFYWLVANILFAAVVLRFAPKLLLPAEDAFTEQPLNNILKASAFLFLVPIGIVLGLFTIIGIPLMLILGLLYILTLVLAPTAAAHWLGRLVWRLQAKGTEATQRLRLSYGQEVAAAGVGFLIAAIIGLVPVVGGLVSLALFLVGLGILMSRGLTPLGGQTALRAKKKST